MGSIYASTTKCGDSLPTADQFRRQSSDVAQHARSGGRRAIAGVPCVLLQELERREQVEADWSASTMADAGFSMAFDEPEGTFSDPDGNAR